MPSPALSPNTWHSGNGTNSTSSAVIIGGSTAASWSRLASSARADSIAPFGRPLVPGRVEQHGDLLAAAVGARVGRRRRRLPSSGRRTVGGPTCSAAPQSARM